MELDEKKIPTIFKAFCDENRVKILKLLLTGEKCACVLLDDMHITQPTLSHHMKILCDCGLVNTQKVGKWSHYSLSCETLTAFKSFIGGLSCCGDEGGGCCK